MSAQPMERTSASAVVLIASLRRNADLIYELARREVAGKYKESWLGMLWALLVPLALLFVYTFVFGVVMNVRWGETHSGSKVEFALMLFVGMLVHTFFSECVSKSPELILRNASYVKKVVFPLEIMAVAAVLSALFHLASALVVFLAAAVVVYGGLPWTAVLFPVVLVPIILFTLGVSWFLTSLGVYFRDVTQFVSLVVILFLFLSPVFYPVSALPERFRFLLSLNPLTLPIESGRLVLIVGKQPDWLGLLMQTALGAAVAYIGFWWFQKTRKGFADVV